MERRKKTADRWCIYHCR